MGAPGPAGPELGKEKGEKQTGTTTVASGNEQLPPLTLDSLRGRRTERVTQAHCVGGGALERSPDKDSRALSLEFSLSSLPSGVSRESCWEACRRKGCAVISPQVKGYRRVA